MRPPASGYSGCDYPLTCLRSGWARGRAVRGHPSLRSSVTLSTRHALNGVIDRTVRPVHFRAGSLTADPLGRMTRSRKLKTVSVLLTVLLVLLLVIAAYFGLSDGFRAVRGAHGSLQVLVSATQLLYGLLAMAALIAVGFGHRAAGALLVGWVAALAVTNGMSPFVWGFGSVADGIKSGVITGLWLGLVVWLWAYCRRRAARASDPRPA